MVLCERDGFGGVATKDSHNVEAVKIFALPVGHLVGIPMKIADQLSHEIFELMMFPSDKDQCPLVLLSGQFGPKSVDIRICEIRLNGHAKFDCSRFDRRQRPEVNVPDPSSDRRHSGSLRERK